MPIPYMEFTPMVAQITCLPAGQHACVGVDLHKDTMMNCTLIRGSGEISWRKIPCKNREQIVEFFQSLPRPHTVAIESVGFYRWLWELLEPIVDELVLADATQARALAGRRLKTDREDAANIAELLAAGRLPLAGAARPGLGSGSRGDVRVARGRGADPGPGRRVLRRDLDGGDARRRRPGVHLGSLPV